VAQSYENSIFNRTPRIRFHYLDKSFSSGYATEVLQFNIFVSLILKAVPFKSLNVVKFVFISYLQISVLVFGFRHKWRVIRQLSEECVVS
jgi:hypothetical protein